MKQSYFFGETEEHILLPSLSDLFIFLPFKDSSLPHSLNTQWTRDYMQHPRFLSSSCSIEPNDFWHDSAALNLLVLFAGKKTAWQVIRIQKA